MPNFNDEAPQEYQSRGGPLPTITRPDSIADDLDSIDGECTLLAALQIRYARLNLGLYPLHGSTLLISSARDGMYRTVPTLQAARRHLAALEA